MSIKKILDGCGPAPSGGRRGIHLNKLFWWIFLGTRKICVISTLTLMGVEIRQTPRAPREVYQKYCLMDVAPAPSCRERCIRTSVEEILQKMFSLISQRPLGRSSKKLWRGGGRSSLKFLLDGSPQGPVGFVASRPMRWCGSRCDKPYGPLRRSIRKTC